MYHVSKRNLYYGVHYVSLSILPHVNVLKRYSNVVPLSYKDVRTQHNKLVL